MPVPAIVMPVLEVAKRIPPPVYIATAHTVIGLAQGRHVARLERAEQAHRHHLEQTEQAHRHQLAEHQSLSALVQTTAQAAREHNVRITVHADRSVSAEPA
ncbi:hypothetical protein [Azospirillum argentinense]|uniref:Uncharacterized protein n=1 Tax=Azospirillum argentinense TaxID=2970906 RepID=A0A5B0KL40_9PROT|nr:hypothetical protein [Azospirillum argentinense]KAA1052493.1 hypothetical protein FH063_004270 [Azospirillum argentinense]